ncbi:MAG: HlyC/CorC family transporter [Deltaproteobacteria bacterium]|jgi:putative hemolysin|nr:HlyC/CorC family transporter [Deltaproteobacteria bacterium]MBW2510261.1 HlyC/CorC family transporter [Deltaproteobacteria bacterium]
MDLITHVAIIMACLVASAFFSSSETALLRLREEEVDNDIREDGGPAVTAAQRLLASTSRLLVTILLGNNIVNILAASVASALAIYYLGEGAGIALSTVLLTLIILIFCEVLPKALAARNPRGVSYLVALPLYLIHQALRPVHAVFDRVVDPFVERVTGGHVGEDEGAALSEEVLRMADRLREGHPQGSPLSIIRAAADAVDTTAEEVMVPRAEILAFDEQIPPSELLENMLNDRFTRVPIYRHSIDEVVGKVHLKDLVALVKSDESNLKSITRPVLRVPPRKPILRLLSDMQRAFIHMAIVKDEFGGTLGIVTQEDVLEELVGEIRDEFDSEELLTVRQVDDGQYHALGRVKVADFNRQTGWDVPAEPGDSLSGLVFNALGHPARNGESIDLAGYKLTVLSVSGTRIGEVSVRCPS